MPARVLKVDPDQPQVEAIQEAARVIQQGGLVAFPSETVYGLGADALNPKAVEGIFRAKGRPFYDPIIVHVADLEGLAQVVRELPPVVEDLARRWMPGPLTLVLPRADAVPDIVTAGRPTVAVRMPAHPVALALIRAARRPIAAPSANRFGHTSPTRAEHVLEDLGDRIDLVLDAGPTPVGVESTVLDLTQEPPVILRPGGVPREELETVLGPLEVHTRPASQDQVRAPGMLARHYAPEGSSLWLLQGSRAQVLEHLPTLVRALRRRGRTVGLLLPQEDVEALALPEDPGVRVVSLGPEAQPEEMARRLFAGLRQLEAQGVDVILAREVTARGLGLAVQDRLRRAADRVLPPEALSREMA